MLGNILKLVPYIGLGLISLLFGYLSFMGIVIGVNKIYYMIRYPKSYLVYTKDDDSFGWVNAGLSISNGNVILGRDVTVLAAVGAADINGAVRSITGGWIHDDGCWSVGTQDCGFRIVPMRANHQIMVMLGTVPNYG